MFLLLLRNFFLFVNYDVLYSSKRQLVNEGITLREGANILYHKSMNNLVVYLHTSTDLILFIDRKSAQKGWRKAIMGRLHSIYFFVLISSYQRISHPHF